MRKDQRSSQELREVVSQMRYYKHLLEKAKDEESRLEVELEQQYYLEEVLGVNNLNLLLELAKRERGYL